MKSRLVIFAMIALLAAPAVAEAAATGSLQRPANAWPDGAAWVRVLSLRDYNTRVVILGTMMLGFASGIVGSFMLLRKRALLGDALSHATLPGIAIAFLIANALGYEAKSLPVLLAGAAVTGVMGVGCILLIRGTTRLKEDAALGIVLSVFFGAGTALLTVVQQLPTGSAGGLESFIYGKTAAMLAGDAWIIGIAAFVSGGICLLLFKEFRLICFDPGYARVQGWPVGLLDVLLTGLVVVVTVIGLQAVGLILVLAMLVVPAAAARFWTKGAAGLALVAGLIGAFTAFFGAVASALFARLPSGATIVLVGTGFFVISMFFGTQRGILRRWYEHRSLATKISRQHLLRAVFESCEHEADPHTGCQVEMKQLLHLRDWTPGKLKRLLGGATKKGYLKHQSAGGYTLTQSGLREARRITRNHRLWELYLIHYADVAPSHVDRDADSVEHVLDPQTSDRLEVLLTEKYPKLAMPPSPH